MKKRKTLIVSIVFAITTMCSLGAARAATDTFINFCDYDGKCFGDPPPPPPAPKKAVIKSGNRSGAHPTTPSGKNK